MEARPTSGPACRSTASTATPGNGSAQPSNTQGPLPAPWTNRSEPPLLRPLATGRIVSARLTRAHRPRVRPGRAKEPARRERTSTRKRPGQPPPDWFCLCDLATEQELAQAGSRPIRRTGCGRAELRLSREPSRRGTFGGRLLEGGMRFVDKAARRRALRIAQL